MKEEKEFTLSAVLFATTGSVPIIYDASDTYNTRVKNEIKKDLVYSYLLSDIPDEIRLSDEDYPNFEPIVRNHICATNLDMKKMLIKYRKNNNNMSFVNTEDYVKLTKITLEEYQLYLEQINNKVNKRNIKQNNKTNNQKRLIKEKKRLSKINDENACY